METRRILLADDEPLVARLYGRALENAGYETAFASDGTEALEHVAAGPFDLILTDMQMPKMTGAQLADELTRTGRKPCPLILLSATDSGEGLVEAVASGCDDFIQKGQSFVDIMSRVRFWLEAPFKALPTDARDAFVARTPEVAAEVTTLRQLGRNRWLLKERALAALADQYELVSTRFGNHVRDRQRLVGVCAGILDHLGRSDPLSYLRRGDLLLDLLGSVAPQLQKVLKEEFQDFSKWVDDPTYRHAKETLVLLPK